MVRQKNRYLLCQFLYPSSPPSPGPKDTLAIPDIITFHQPTSNTLTAQLLTRAIRADVATLFGDYGAGVIAASLSSMFFSPDLPFSSILSRIYYLLLLTQDSEADELISFFATVKYLSPATSTFIVRVARAQYRLVWAALSFMTHIPIDGTPCVVRVLRVSGTIRKAEEEAVRRARLLVIRVRKGQEGLLGGDAGVENGLDEVGGEIQEEEDLGEVVDVGSFEDEDDDEEDEVDDDDDGQEGDSGEE
jgi:ribonuclease P/MRP protein subunit POP5